MTHVAEPQPQAHSLTKVQNPLAGGVGDSVPNSQVAFINVDSEANEVEQDSNDNS